MTLKQHPLSKIFPSLPDDELHLLAKDIKEHGLHSAITLHKGEVLDGWHRYQACLFAKVNPRTQEYKGKDPAAFVKSMNWHRRHLNASQRALAEVQLSEWATTGRPGNSAPGAEFSAGAEKAATTAEMAARAGTSKRTIEDAKSVELNGSDAVKEAVREGKISVKAAANIAKKPKREQKKAIKEAKAPKQKKQEPREEHGDSLAKELEAADKTIRSQQTLIDSLKSSDLAIEVEKWSLKFDQLDGRLQQCMKTKAEAERQAKYATAMLAKIRKILNVETNAQILQVLAK